jgi:hypothetical protein
MKHLTILSCGIFKPELEKIIPEVQAELADTVLKIVYVPSALHQDEKKLEEGLRAALKNFDLDEKIVVLFGCMCHHEMARILSDAGFSGAPFLKMPNCIGAFLPPQKKQELDAGLNVHYMSAGWIQFWQDIFAGGPGWDPVSARMALGVNDKIIILDTGCRRLSDEELFEIFEYTQLPIEVEVISTDFFKTTVLELCKQASAKNIA